MHIGPKFLFMTVNRRCNLRCEHCIYWKNEDKDDYLSLTTRQEFIREFGRIAQPDAAVVICGGESMLDYDVYMGVAEAARSNGLRCLSVINGTRVKTPETAREMVTRGPTEITISVDSPYPDIHDEIRGVKNAHFMAIRALELLLHAREQLKTQTKIYAMAVVSERNYRDLDLFYNFILHQVGADKLKLNILQPSFGNVIPDVCFKDNTIKDIPEFLAILKHCGEKYALHLNPEWIETVQMYLRSVPANNPLRGWLHRTGTPQPICNTYERNIMLDEYGFARLCFSPAFPGERVTPGTLGAFWNRADAWRYQMRTCTRFCGISHSVRRVAATRRPVLDNQHEKGAPDSA